MNRGLQQVSLKSAQIAKASSRTNATRLVRPAQVRASRRAVISLAVPDKSTVANVIGWPWIVTDSVIPDSIDRRRMWNDRPGFRTAAQQPDEVFSSGPLRMMRFGRDVVSQTNWLPGAV